LFEDREVPVRLFPELQEILVGSLRPNQIPRQLERPTLLQMLESPYRIGKNDAAITAPSMPPSHSHLAVAPPPADSARPSQASREGDHHNCNTAMVGVRPRRHDFQTGSNIQLFSNMRRPTVNNVAIGPDPVLSTYRVPAPVRDWTAARVFVPLATAA
jgi:hypothetical protein